MSTEEKKTFFQTIAEYFLEALGGFSISSIGAIIAPEIIHFFFVILGGVGGTFAIHYTRKYLIPKFDKWMDKKPKA